MPTGRQDFVNVRIDPDVKTALIHEARQCGRTFSAHVRRKLGEGSDDIDARLERLERRSLFTVLAFRTLFEGLGREEEIEGLIGSLDMTGDPLAPEVDDA